MLKAMALTHGGGHRSGLDFTADWALLQAETGDVTLTATDSDTKETVSLRYVRTGPSAKAF